VVSLPCWERFARLGEDERSAVLPPGIPAVGVEAGTAFGWHRWVDASVSIERFGASAPGGTVMAELGITADHVVDVARHLLAGKGA
jgi:transketolase